MPHVSEKIRTQNVLIFDTNWLNAEQKRVVLLFFNIRLYMIYMNEQHSPLQRQFPSQSGLRHHLKHTIDRLCLNRQKKVGTAR